MEKLLVIALAASLLALIYTPAEEHSNLQDLPDYGHFLKWCDTYNKVYGSKQEQHYRFTVYMRNLMKLRQYDQHRTTDQIEMGENAFMDLDYSEFKALMMKGRRRPKGYRVSEDKIVYLNITDLPENVDWRGKAVPKVKNQGNCGGCWAFSTAGALEGAWAVDHPLVELSEQQIIDCCRLNLYGCNGGDPIVALDECILRDGIMRASDYPFTAVTSRSCNYDSNSLVYTPKDYAIVPHNNSIQLQMALTLHPIAVCISDSAEFHFYKKGIISDLNCGIDNDHCIVAVGYGTENGKDYWLLRNSWSETWGEEGYVRVKRNGDGPGICGVQQEGVYVIV